ncbi:hypothetical protein [Pedobacter sp.]|uniref:hypothetical protein n=1 Tax=Pedobacter sp. TaxID=1411316 RepID=UPI003D7F8DDF
MKFIYLLMLLIFPAVSFCQDQDDFTKRLKAIKNQSTTYYNIDGIEFTSETYNDAFAEKGLKKIYKRFSIKDTDAKIKDEVLAFNNLNVTKTEKLTDELSEINSYYILENKNKTISVIWFGFYNKADKEFERKYVSRILNDEIPPSVFEAVSIDSVDFAGRKMTIGNKCYWANINSIQCPYDGQMNWSVHKSMESAQTALKNQLSVTKSKKGVKVSAEEEVEVIFEGVATKAKRIIYDFSGLKSLLAGASGGKNLTVYYVASPVRGNYVSCVMSFWNNDNISAKGLTPLLEKVMALKN